MRSSFEHRVVDGKTYWFTGSAPAARLVSNTAHLLPNYDEVFIGLKDRSAMSELVKTPVVGVWGSTFVANVVAVEGQLAGGWTRSVTARGVVLQVQLAVELKPSQLRAIENQAQRYGEFLQLPVKLAVRDTARLHH